MTSSHLSKFLDEEIIRQRITLMADELLPRLQPDPVVIGVMKGAFIFTADMVRALCRLGLDPEIDFITVSSYRLGLTSPGTIEILLDHTLDVRHRQVLLLDDIIDSGFTMNAVQKHLREKGVQELISVVLLNKPSRRQIPTPLDGHCFEVPDQFIVGYGLDHANRHRGLPHLAWIRS
ncbi:MAG: hypoxanthine phosphoribosyltransferase [Magnetococcales bacterium]|nr:hypoxanthine phosphoribosyltransferase [Magnetococcales bacterium]